MLWGVVLCIALNWLGDSLDGTLARVRAPAASALRLLCRPHGRRARRGGNDGWPGLLRAVPSRGRLCHAGRLLFLVLACESYLATYALGRFELSQGLFGPTELRLLLIAGNLALLHSPWCTVLHHRMLLFDLGGSIAVVGMTVVALVTAARHTAQLYREEPLP